VFEIGNSLREARVRRGIEFPQAEIATKIRGKYLRALEDEQFNVLPAQTYIKGFLRTYAEYLGLDGQLYVDEYNSRFVSGADEHEPRARRSAARPQPRHGRIETNAVLVALGAIAVLTVIVISAWKASGGSPPVKTPPASTTAAHSHPLIVPPLLEVIPLTGATHLIVHKTTANGKLLFDGTLSAGDAAHAFHGSRLWLQVDSPENLRFLVRGKLVHVSGAAPRVIFVTKTGWRPA
jgi:hypothetical protein